MTWFNILKTQARSGKSKREDIAFLTKLKDEIVKGVESIFNVELVEIGDGESKYYISSEVVVEFSPHVGFHVKPLPFRESSLWGNRKETILPDTPNREVFRNEGLDKITFRTSLNDLFGGFMEEAGVAETEDDFNTINYSIGADNMYDAMTFGIYIKEDNPKIEALAEDINRKMEERWPTVHESQYTPRYPMAHSPEEDRNITPEEAMPKDDWKDSLKDKR